MIADDLCILEPVHIILAGRRALFCAVEGKRVWVARGHVRAGSDATVGDGRRLVLPRWLAQHLGLPARAFAVRPVLLVDDDDEARGLMARTLETAGYQVAQATDGLHALELLRDGLDPTLILLDLKMPGMDAAGFRAEQQRDEALAGIPVLLMSASPDVEAAAAAIGIPHFCRKPVPPSELLALVDRHRASR